MVQRRSLTHVVGFTVLAFGAVALVQFVPSHSIAAREKKTEKKLKAESSQPANSPAAPPATEKQPADPALERTRDVVRMLDDIYKSVVVLITDKYVHSEKHFPAGSAAVALFAAVKKKGWHEVRLLDATGDPIVDTNAPQDDFEKKAIQELKSGKDYYEEIVTIDGKRTLRAATPVPVVMEKCIMCHPHYKEVKKGAPIGALSYTLTIK
ncbi:MAG: DUF3365 domain-containing protein [Planctomycetales bacterium]